MVTEKQIMANRENGKKGGPKTETGKAVVKYNARTHGLLSQQVILPGEDQDAFEDMRVALKAALKPEGELENMLFDMIVSTYWRLARVATLETCYIQANLGVSSYDYSVEDCNKAVHYMFSGTGGRIANLNRYETSLERKLYKALHELQRLQMERKKEKPQAPVAIDVDVSHEV